MATVSTKTKVKPGFILKPRAYQLECYEKSKDEFFYGVLLDPGLGKTKVTIDNICYLAERSMIDSVLIVAPKGCYHDWGANNEDKPDTWPTEPHDERPQWTKHAWKQVKERSHVYLWDNRNTKANNKLQNEILKPVTGTLKILIMNTEAFSSTRGTVFASKFLRANKKPIMVVDEASMMRGHKSQRTKNLTALGRAALYRRILTGTPIANSPLDLFGPARFLSTGIFGENYFTFRSRYAILKEQFIKNRSFKVVVGYQRIEDMQSRIRPYSYRKTKDECEDLPGKIYMRRTLELTNDQKKAYLEMRDRAVHELENERTVTATVVIAKIAKMRQILSGFIIDDDKILHELEETKTDEVMQVLQETSGKSVIWSPYRFPVERMCAALEKEYGKDSYIKYIGGTDNRQELVARFLSSKECNYFVATEQTGKFGLSFPGVTDTHYLGNDPDLEIRLQSEDRTYGIGRGSKTVSSVYTDYVYPGTIDVEMLNALVNKKKLSDLITGDAWRGFLTMKG